jgi:hypothetical protein
MLAAYRDTRVVTDRIKLALSFSVFFQAPGILVFSSSLRFVGSQLLDQLILRTGVLRRTVTQGEFDGLVSASIQSDNDGILPCCPPKSICVFRLVDELRGDQLFVGWGAMGKWNLISSASRGHCVRDFGR